MKRNTKVVLVAMGLVGVMASVSFAATDGAPIKDRVFNGRDRIAPRERIMENTGFCQEEGLESKRAGMFFREFTEEEKLDFEAKREEVLQRKFQFIDEKVASGDLTAEEGEDLKAQLQERMEDWQGEAGLNQRRMKGRRMMNRERVNRTIQSGE